MAQHRRVSALRIGMLLAPFAVIALAARWYVQPLPPNESGVSLSDAFVRSVRSVEFATWKDLPLLRAGTYEIQSSTQIERHVYDYPWTSRLLLRGHPLFLFGNRDMNNFRCRGRQAHVHRAQLIPLELSRSECEEPHIEGLVLARFDGPGVLAHFWMTLQTMLDRPPAEMLRVYVDDEPKALAVVPVRAFVEPNRSALLEPPYSAQNQHSVAWYAPVAYRKRLVIALDDIDSMQSVYYEAAAIHRDVDRPRNASNHVDHVDARSAVRSVRAANDDVILQQDITLVAHTTASAELIGPMTITALDVRYRDADREALHAISVSIAWDDQAQPAIDIPLLDLFNAMRRPPFNGNEALGARRDGEHTILTLRLPAPFDRSAALRFANQGSLAASFQVIARGVPGVPTRPWGYLHVQRSTSNGPSSGRSHAILDATGPGRLVGVCGELRGELSAESAPFFLEGDVVLAIDGVRHRGTGTEDYFNGAFFFADGQSTSTFAQVWGNVQTDEAFEVSACRWHVLSDAIDFQQTLRVDMEIGPTRNSEYQTVAYTYRR